MFGHERANAQFHQRLLPFPHSRISSSQKTMQPCLARPAASALLPPPLLPLSAPTNLASLRPVLTKINNFLPPRPLRSCFGAGLRNNLPKTLLPTPLSLHLGFTSPYRGLERVLRVGLSVVRAGRVEMASIGKLKREELQVYGTAEEMTVSLAEHVAHVSAEAVKARGAFTVVLSGGSLITMLGKLCETPYLNSIDWTRWHVFWADERVVKKDHPDSNYKLAWDGLLSKVPVPSGNVYAINDSLSTEAAAEDYESAIKHLTKAGVVAMTDGYPRFDLLLLGMGPDGHCCSLFPNHPLVLVKDKWIAPITDSPKPPPERITFTMPVVQAAANVTFVAQGEGKAEMLAKVFGEELPLGQLPSQSARPLKGKLIWFADKAAASKL